MSEPVAFEIESIGTVRAARTEAVDVKPVIREFLPRADVVQPAWCSELMSGDRRIAGMVAVIAFALVFSVGCSKSGDDAFDPADWPGYVACTEPRPEMCTRDYRPVCARRDVDAGCEAGVCDLQEWETASNACTACSDPSHLGYRPGACPEGG